MRRWGLAGMAMLLALAMVAPAWAQRTLMVPAPRLEVREAAVRNAVKSYLMAVGNKDLPGVQNVAYLPGLVVRGPGDSTTAQIVVARQDNLAQLLLGVPAIPGADSLAADVAANLTITFLGDNVAVGILYPRPQPGAGPLPGCGVLLGKLQGAGWKVACFIFGPAAGQLADQVEPLKGSIASFWQALLNRDFNLLRATVNLPYLDVKNERSGADLQAVTAELLKQLERVGASLGEETPQEGLTPEALVADLQVRFFGQAAAVALYSSGFNSFGDQPQECAMLARGADGQWRIVAVASD